MRHDIKNNVEFRYTDLEKMLSLNLGDNPAQQQAYMIDKPP
jgi:hypothetical protein